MQLLSKVPSLEDYYRDLSSLLTAQHTHLYIDTSFLMWLSKLGPAARAEFISWVDELGPDRIHIPLWASHEYHQHFVESTIKNSAKQYIASFNKAAKNFYSELLPAIVEADDLPRINSVQIKTDTRQAVLDLLKSSSVIEKWCNDTWDERAAAIIAFINQYCLKSGRTFEYLNTIGQTTDNRFSGRVPPGFQDRIKKDTQDSGGNRAGDLMFWKEILDHARDANKFLRYGVKSIVVLTNDGKNDWIAGGNPAMPDGSIEALKGIQGEESRVPIIHPMLEHEAQVYSRVQRVILMNSFAVGMHFSSINKAPKFVEVTISTRIPKYERKDDRVLKVAGRQAKAAPLAAVSMESSVPKEAGQERLAVEMGDKLLTPLQLQTFAISNPGDIAREAESILSDFLSIGGAASPITDWLNEDLLIPANAKKLVWIGRLLANRAIEKMTHAHERIIDLLAMLDLIEVNPASQLYTGILFGIYFDEHDQPRVGIRPEFTQLIFKHQKAEFARPAIDALRNAIGPDEEAIIYLPSHECPIIEAELITTRAKPAHLSALLIGGVDYLTNVEEDDPRSFSKLLGGTIATVLDHDLIVRTAQALGFPIDQIQVKNGIGRQVSIDATHGINIKISGEE